MLSQSRVREMKTILKPGFAKKTSGRRQPRKWNCKLSETLIGEYLLVPLTSAKMLKSEGYWMNSCCREYVNECADLKYSIFSIRSRSGGRVATLGLVYDEDYWRFDQCLGQSNTDVLEETRGYLDEDGVLHTELFATELYYVAHEVVRLMNSTNNTQ